MFICVHLWFIAEFRYKFFSSELGDSYVGWVEQAKPNDDRSRYSKNVGFRSSTQPTPLFPLLSVKPEGIPSPFFATVHGRLMLGFTLVQPNLRTCHILLDGLCVIPRSL